MSAPRRTAVRAPSFRRAVGDEQKDRRRLQILAGAKRVFAAKGYQEATIGAVAKAAKVSYGTVYWYFDSKEALLHALMEHEEQLFRDHVAGVITAAEEDGGGAGVFRAAVAATLERFDADRAAVKLLFRDSSRLGGQSEHRLHEIYEGFIDDIAAMIEAAQDAGELVPAPPRLVAFSVAALISQVALRRLETDDGLDTARAADFIVSMVLEGLVPR
jgi:AcrR family transcriptional regulator